MRESIHEAGIPTSAASGSAPVLLTAIFLLFSPIASMPAAADSEVAAKRADIPISDGPEAERIEPAPGGGDMILLAPDRAYIARIRTDDKGSVSVKCDHPDPNRDTNAAEQ